MKIICNYNFAELFSISFTDLKLGALAHSRPKHAKFVAKQDSKKKTEVILAIVLSSPIKSTNSTMIADTKTAPIGFVPIVKQLTQLVTFPVR